MTTRLDRKLECPYCGLGNDGATGVNTADGPGDGDVSLCIRCAGLALFVGTPPVAVREPDREELAKLAADPAVAAAQRAIYRMPPYGRS